MNGTMRQVAVALLDLRRIFHLALALTAIAMVYQYGPASARVLVDSYLMTPVFNATAAVGRQVGSGATMLRGAIKHLGRD